MITLITGIHIFVCFFLILLVLLQSGKGADISASFGGSSQTVFGSSGGANFFSRLTAGTAFVFVLTSIFLTIQGTSDSKKSLFENEKAPVAPVTAPAGDAAATQSTDPSAAQSATAAPKPATEAPKK